ncbi:hypothetical protein ACHAXN_008105 [Cyclotella atomus]
MAASSSSTSIPQTATKMTITNVVTPVSDEIDTLVSSAASTVDAALRGLILGAKFEQIARDSACQPSAPSATEIDLSPNGFGFDAVGTAASLAVAITDNKAAVARPVMPTLDDCNFVPLQPSYSQDSEAAVAADIGSSEEKVVAEESWDPELLEAASILCMLSNARPNAEDVSVTMELMAPTFEYSYENYQVDVAACEEEEYLDEDEDMYEEPLPKRSSSSSAPPPLLRHPDRLAIEDDVDEVNQLHQYVRSDLLEIFVVPQIQDEDSDDDDGSYCPKLKYERVTRGNSYSGTLSNSNSNNRHYPGRVGFRCIHCANVRPTSAQTTKSSFYPLRLHNLYREVCAWQRIHFKNCPFVPKEVRGRYDWLKESDTSRGKVRYWEISAVKIGLVNNPDREDGIIFSDMV